MTKSKIWYKIKIENMKSELQELDKYDFKFIEGIITQEQFEPIISQKQSIRAKINEYEQILEQFKEDES